MRKIILCLILTFTLCSFAGAAEFQRFKDTDGFWGSQVISGGPTNDAYPATGSANCRWGQAFKTGEKTLFIYNTGGANNLHFKILAYPTSEQDVIPYVLKDSAGTEQLDIVVQPNNTAVINTNDKVEILEIYLKNATAGNSTTFECIATGARIR